MLSRAEKERLLKAYRNDRAYGLAVVLKCAAGLLILVGLAVIGTSDPSPQAPAVANARGAAPQRHSRAPAAEPGTGSGEKLD